MKNDTLPDQRIRWVHPNLRYDFTNTSVFAEDDQGNNGDGDVAAAMEHYLSTRRFFPVLAAQVQKAQFLYTAVYGAYLIWSL